MKLTDYLKLISLLPFVTQTVVAQQRQRAVFAHFMHGLTAEYTADLWRADIKAAKAVGIDGFALNIAHDWWTEQQLDSAYNVADLVGGFKLLISFDQLCCGPFSASEVARLITKYKDRSSQYKVDNRPFVSTFEGTDFIDSWAGVRQKVDGGIFLVPDWASLGPPRFSQHVGKVDGAFPWDAWSKTPDQKTTEADQQWRNVLGGKPYMMAVSPWFFVNAYGKNWLWKGDSLWYTRWEQVIDFGPDYVEIISWNDYSESHYIGPINPPGIVPEAQRYVDGMPHDGWRFILPYYISAYKAGTRSVPIPQEGFAYWYRLTPKANCDKGGTTCSLPNNPQAFEPAQCVDDTVYVASLSNSAAQVEIYINGEFAGRGDVGSGASLFSAPFAGRQGPVTVKLIKGGAVFAQATGASISNGCPPDGKTNWNAWVGSAPSPPVLKVQ